jgi:hypothetical protein
MAISNCVVHGRFPAHAKISNNFGTTIVIITIITQITTITIIAGYIRADFNFPFIEAIFSTCSAKSFKETFNFQVFSQDSIIQTSAGEKEAGYNDRHSESHFHSFNSFTNLLRIFFNTVCFFSCFSKIATHFERVIPEFNIVESKRKNITLSFTVSDCLEIR